ncbi:PqqD family protein [Myxococcota bacterium]|nr:PqqD family protein [Myxococcota bacterium]MBU1535695.1 PqqD family protein [Myxococcota bacterium]
MTTYRIPKGIASRKLSEEFFLLSPKTSTMHTLNPMGSAMLTLLSNGKSPREIGEILSQEFDARAETIEKDANDLVTLLLDQGLLEVTGEKE